VAVAHLGGGVRHRVSRLKDGHSLRAGHATSASANGAPERVIMAQTGHKSLNMVRRYIRDGSLFRENSAAFLGL
jgi:integrase